jgi:uncharacterized membrane protein YjdF
VAPTELTAAAEPASTPARAAAFRAVAWSATALFAAISLAPIDGPANYRYSALFLVPLTWLVYALRRRLELHPAHFALLASAALLHDLGAFGCYYERYFGFEFDAYVHGWLGFVSALVLSRLLGRRTRLGSCLRIATVVLLVAGFGALHEIVEAASTLLLGEHGMFSPANDPYDTQKDLLNNVLGALAAAAGYVFWPRTRGYD